MMSIYVLAGATNAVTASAQVSYGGPQSTPSNSGAAVSQPSGGTTGVAAPSLPAFAPDTLPPPPGGGFGFPNPLAPPYSVTDQIPTLISPPTLRLTTPQAGVVPLQSYDPAAPAILIRPYASVGEIFTDNVNFAHSPRKFAAISSVSAGASVSADTPRLQAVATGAVTGNLYLPSTSSSLNQVFGNLYANGLATFVPDLFFFDFQSSITQSTPLPGFGFQNLSTLPSNLQTQQYINNISPYIRKSFDGALDTELRYRFASTNYGGNTTVTAPPLAAAFGTLANSTLNEGTFVAATGADFQKVLVRFTADASDYNTTSTAQNTQVSAYDDFEYRFTPTVAALGRAGYQNLRYPFSPAATFAGATWLAGGRIGTLGPDQPAFLSLQYGKQQGVYGFTGAAQVSITPTMLLTASLLQGITSQGQAFQNNLANSTLSPSGGIVNQSTGLPTAFYNPGIGLSNSVYRQHLFNVGLTDAIGPNGYAVYGYYTEQQSLTPPITPPTKSVGINFNYTRDIRPDLRGYASIGYANTVNSPTTVFTTSTTNFNTLTAAVGVNYVLSQTLTGSILYSFAYQSNAVNLSGGNGDAVVNQLQFLLSKTF